MKSVTAASRRCPASALAASLMNAAMAELVQAAAAAAAAAAAMPEPSLKFGCRRDAASFLRAYGWDSGRLPHSCPRAARCAVATCCHYQ